jgi:hypothetical protein
MSPLLQNLVRNAIKLRGEEGVDAGNKVRVRLVQTDVDKGIIDFEKFHSNL